MITYANEMGAFPTIALGWMSDIPPDRTSRPVLSSRSEPWVHNLDNRRSVAILGAWR